MNRSCKSTNAEKKLVKSSLQLESNSTKSTNQPKSINPSKKSSKSNEPLFGKYELDISSILKCTTTTPTSTTTAGTNVNRIKKNKGLVNHDYCSYCEEGGELLNCDRCPASFHLMCNEPPLSADQIPPGEFLCNKCNARAILLASTLKVNEPDINLPISNELNTVKFEVGDEEAPLEVLIRMAKSLNPRQMQLSDELSVECAFDLPGLNKIKWWTKDGNKIVNIQSSSASTNPLNHEVFVNGIHNGTPVNSLNGFTSLHKQQSKASSNTGDYSTQTSSQHELCFTCVKNGKENQLVKCDFCPLRYHLDCLNPPLCTMPARDRLWMCPNHMENFLDQNLLESTRLSERINLWKQYSAPKMNLNNVKIDFINKCSRTGDTNKENLGQEETHVDQLPRQSVKRCEIPCAIKQVYSQMKNLTVQTETPVEAIEISKRTFADEQEKESYLLAIEALQLLSKSSVPTQPVLNELLSEDQSYTGPPLNKFCKEAIKPRAFLQHIPSDSFFDQTEPADSSKIYSQLSKSLEFNILNYEKYKHKLPSPQAMSYRSLTVGTASNMDICLNMSKCDCLSEKHACVYYDEQTNHYELLNYSEHGTVVDNFLYGLDLDESLSELDDSSDSELQESTAQMSARRLNKEVACKCSSQTNNLSGKCWEGPAILNHGSHLQFGCLNFLFIIVDYEFVGLNDLSPSQQPVRFTPFYDLKKKKKSPPITNELSLVKKRKQLIGLGNRDELKTTDASSATHKKSNKNAASKKFRMSSSAAAAAASGSSNLTAMRKLKLDKIEAFLKLMNNKNKKNLLDLP